MYEKMVFFGTVTPTQTPLLSPDMLISAFPQTSTADSGKARKISPVSCRELS